MTMEKDDYPRMVGELDPPFCWGCLSDAGKERELHRVKIVRYEELIWMDGEYVMDEGITEYQCPHCENDVTSTVAEHIGGKKL